MSNLGFHAPPNHPGIASDGTVGSAGYSNAAWSVDQTAAALSWSSETLAQNPNANALRWGTLYNFRFDSNRPPQPASATIAYFKTGAPTTVAIEGPAPMPCAPLQLASVVSRKTHGDAGDFDIPLPLQREPGVECRSSGGNHTLVATFSNSMMAGSATVTSGTGNVLGSPVFNGNTMTTQLTGVTDAQKLTVTLSGVTDSFGQVMPDTAVTVNVLVGDINGSRAVNATDIAQWKSQSSGSVTAGNFRADINASGTLSATDLAELKANAGHAVP